MKRPSDETLRRLREQYRHAVSLRGTTERDSCPDPQAILDLVEGRSIQSERLASLDHVMQCPGCRREFDLLRALHEARPQHPTWIRPWMRSAASVIVLLGAGYGIWRWMDGGSPVYRGSSPEIELVGPAPDESVSSEVRFVWRSDSDAFEYTLEVMDPRGQTIFHGATADTFLVVNLQEHPQMRGSVSWWVRGHRRDGTEITSEARPLDLRAP